MDAFVFSIITACCLSLALVTGIIGTIFSRPRSVAVARRRVHRPRTPEEWAEVDRLMREHIALIHYEGMVLEWQELHRLGQVSLATLYDPPFPERRPLHPQLPAGHTIPKPARLTRPLTLEDIVFTDHSDAPQQPIRR